MTIERLYEFIVLANTLNFSKAADKLYITQSILSRHILDMEKELDTQLFQRTTHGVTLTSSGRILLKDALPLVRKSNQIQSLLHTAKLVGGGKIQIACSEQTLCTPILEFLKEFKRKYDDIHLNLEPIQGGMMPELLDQNDIVFSPFELAPKLSPDINRSYLISQSALLAVPPLHPLGSKQFVSLEELENETLLVPFSDEIMGPYAQNALLVEKYTHGHINRIGVATAQTALLMVELGQGIAVIPHHLNKRVYNQTRTIAISTPECKFSIYLFHNTKNENTAATLLYQSALNYFQD